MSNKFHILAELGAGEFEHLDGSLINHLNATKELLEQWGASIELQDAGLYHGVYGTDGFSQHLVSTSQRGKIAAIIGSLSEEIVYQYCACDRGVFFPVIGIEKNPKFLNRFTGESHPIPESALRDFCELTAANEIEIAIDNPEFVNQHGIELSKLFRNMAPYLSAVAQEKATAIFGVVHKL